MCQPGRPRPIGGIPGSLAGLGGLPEGKVAGRVLLILVHIDARAVFHAAQVFLAQLAVLRKGGQAEVPGAVFGLVGSAGRGQLLDQLDHARNVLGGAGNDLGPLDAQGIQILKEGLLRNWRVYVADGNAGGCGVADDLVVHVGDVHDVAERHSRELEEAAENVYLQESAEVADVAVVVDRGPAGVHAQRFAVHGDELVELSREGIEKADRHWWCRTSDSYLALKTGADWPF